jgi:FG-GAP repeat
MKTQSLAATLILSMLSALSHAQVLNENLKITAKDGLSGDVFGSAVAINKEFIAIGAPSDDANGFDSGSLYIYNHIGNFLRNVTPADANLFDAFASAIDINDNGVAIIGATGGDGKSPDSGAAYLYNVAIDSFISKLTPDDGAPFDNFGKAVALGPSFVAVGSPGHDFNGSSSGAVYLFNAIVGGFISKLTPTDGAAFDGFGTSVAVDGNIAAIGAPGDSDNGIGSGSVYTFDMSTGLQLNKITPSDGAGGDNFGCAVSIKNGILAVGATGDDDNGSQSGSAYLFNAFTGEFISKLVPPDGQSFDQFASELKLISSEKIAIGSHGNDQNGTDSGAAYLFNTITNTFIVKFVPSDGATQDQFARSIAVYNDTVVIGSIGDDDLGSFSGSAYLFDINANPCPADLNGDGALNFFDVSAFLIAFSAQDPTADFNNDGLFNFFDVSAFLIAFANGCP